MDYAKIYEQYADNVYRYIYLMVHKKEIAEDLTQETFIKVLKNLNQFNQTSSLNTWIIKIAKNTTYDYFRKIKWVSFFTDNNNVPDTIIASAEDKVIQKNDLQNFYNVLKTLKRDYQEVIILRKINEFSTKEAAIILGWSEDKVKTKLSRGMKKLIIEMTKNEEGYYGKTRTN